jgi:nitroreductase
MSAESAGAIKNRASLAPDVLEAILKHGVSAPSGDNLQPWRFSWRQDALLVYHDNTKDTSLYNVQGLASFIALGAAIENIVIAASIYGYHANVKYFPAGDSSAVAEILFMEHCEPDPLATAIPERCVNRKPYTRHRLSSEIIAKLDNDAQKFPAVALQWIQDSRGLKMLGKSVIRADRLLFENPHLHKQLFSCLRWTSEEVERTRDGLPVATLELGKLGTHAFRSLRSWRLVSILNRLGFSRMVARHSGKLIRTSSAAALISVSKISADDFLEAGRVFERLWLNATLQGLSLQPMTGFVFLQLRSALAEYEGLTPAQLDLLESLRRELAALFTSANGGVPAMLFRLGVAPSPSDRTIRRPLSEVLASDK